MTTRNHQTMVATIGLAIANLGIAIPWGPDTDALLVIPVGPTPIEWLLNTCFVLLVIGLVIGWLRSTRLLQWSAQGSAGLWTMTGWYLWLTSGGSLHDISLGIVCWGIAAMAFSIDYTSSRGD